MKTKRTEMQYGTILYRAHQAGRKAGDALKPVPMIVGDAISLTSTEIDYSKPTEYVADGVCGFAWVRTYEHGNGPFVKFLKKYNYGRKTYHGGGYYITHANPSSSYGQGLQKKEAYCRAYAKVLNSYGLSAQVESRLD